MGPLDAQTTKEPVILFVPGYTFGPVSKDMKDNYFADQRRYFTNLGRDVLYLNTPNDAKLTYRDFAYKQFELGAGNDPTFDSREERIGVNACAIVKVLKVLQGMGRKVTIVSHSKGGQDVLHALIDLDDSQQPKNKHLWPIVAGWLAYTSNFFESRFEVEKAILVTDPGVTAVWTRPKEASCPFRYAQYHVDGGLLFSAFIQRQQYMKDHRDVINELTATMRILCAYGSFVPALSQVDLLNPGDLDKFNMRIQTQSQDIEFWSTIRFCGANDGLVPMRAAQLPGAKFSVHLPSDTQRQGVDHDSPAGSRPQYAKFWTSSFRIEMTETYISKLEGFASFGRGCQGTSGVPILDAKDGSVPVIGKPFTLELSSLPIGAVTAMLFGFSNQAWGPIPLPFDLTPLQAPGCFWLVSVDGIDVVTNTNGVAPWTITIPPSTQLVGLEFFNQGLVLDSSANALGITFSNGGAAKIVRR